MTYQLKLNDFVKVIENKSSFNPDDLIHICKRYKNPKRDYLFVNKYQAKHYPSQASTTIQLFKELYEQIKDHLSSQERILIIAFAETATAIGQAIMHFCLENDDLNAVFYLQTTREDLDTTIKTLSFEEEHSHATNQKLYYREDIPEYDTILFIEDEITTGNTILNFITEFKKLNKKTKYAVASILNWQNKSHASTYKEENIDTIYLIKGKLKDAVPTISIDYQNLPENNLDQNEKVALSSKNNPRLGLTQTEFRNYSKSLETLISKLDDSPLDSDSYEVRVIGTEENMWLPILLAQHIGAKVRSTTRSPIAISPEDNYLIKNAIHLPSAYNSQRSTYLYNVTEEVDRYIIVYEEMTKAFEESIREQLQPYSRQEIIFIQQ